MTRTVTDYRIVRNAKYLTVTMASTYARSTKMSLASVRPTFVMFSLVACWGCGFAPPRYTREQAEQKVGHSVVCIQSTENQRLMKCPDEGGKCLPVYPGDQGRVVRIDPIENNKFGIKIQWFDEAGPTGYYSFEYADSPQIEFR